MATDAAEEEKVLQMIKSVGSGINSARVRELNGTVNKLRDENKELQVKLAESEGSYEQQNRSSNSELIRVLELKNSVIRELQQMKANVEDELMEYKRSIIDKDARISALTKALLEKEAELDDIANFRVLKETIEATHATALAGHKAQQEGLQREVEEIKAKVEEDERTRNVNLREVMQAKEDNIREQLEVSMREKYSQMESDHSRMQKELHFQGDEIESILSQNEQYRQGASAAAAEAKNTEEINLVLMKRMQWYKRQLAKLQAALEAGNVAVPEFSEYDGDGASILRDDMSLSTIRSYSASRAAGSHGRASRGPAEELRKKLTTRTNFVVHEFAPLSRGAVMSPAGELPTSPMSGSVGAAQQHVAGPSDGSSIGAFGGGVGGDEASTATPATPATATEAELESVYDDLETVLSDRLRSKKVSDSIVHINNFKVARAKELEEELLRQSSGSPKKAKGSSGTKARVARPPMASSSPQKEPAPHRAARTMAVAASATTASTTSR